MTVEVRYYTDPACSWSWASEPKIRRLMWEFDGELGFRWVMGGLARRFDPEWVREHGLPGGDPGAAMALHWLDVAARSGMPWDPLLWAESPPASSYPACMAVKAACEQGWEAGYRYLRRLREGLMCERRKLDHAEALQAQAGPAGLDAERFRIDLSSHAITEAFAADLEEVRDVPAAARGKSVAAAGQGKERLPLPSAVFIGAEGSRAGVWGWQPYEAYREAAEAAGARRVNEEPLEPLAVVHRFGRAATREVVELSGRPGPVVGAELWRAAAEWRLRPASSLIGELWEEP